jgi:2-polyprenyl-3-methyl-5-hydroxy-6-metoxy-1,4-benzoquinol methylase
VRVAPGASRALRGARRTCAEPLFRKTDGGTHVTDATQQTRDRYLERIALYTSAGYDRPAAARWVIDQLGRLEGPVLDVGTGQGLLATELARLGASVVSIDVDAEEQRVGMVNATYEGVAERITFMTADARDLPFVDGAFGTIATLDALHHLADGPTVFSELRRVVRPSGRILLAELTAEGFALVARLHEREGRVHPVGPVTIVAAVDWFVSHGFRPIARKEDHLHAVAILEKLA